MWKNMTRQIDKYNKKKDKKKRIIFIVWQDNNIKSYDDSNEKEVNLYLMVSHKEDGEENNTKVDFCLYLTNYKIHLKNFTIII
ncbi:hypothetical protein CR513_53867, partial [Mucuna pruriens]